MLRHQQQHLAPTSRSARQAGRWGVSRAVCCWEDSCRVSASPRRARRSSDVSLLYVTERVWRLLLVLPQKQEQSDHILDDLSCMLGCTRSSLHGERSPPEDETTGLSIPWHGGTPHGAGQGAASHMRSSVPGRGLCTRVGLLLSGPCLSIPLLCVFLGASAVFASDPCACAAVGETAGGMAASIQGRDRFQGSLGERRKCRRRLLPRKCHAPPSCAPFAAAAAAAPSLVDADEVPNINPPWRDKRPLAASSRTV